MRAACPDASEAADDNSERIRDFLSTFEQDVADGLADIELQDDDDMPARTKSLKYMKQLVRPQHSCECAWPYSSHSKGWRTGNRRGWSSISRISRRYVVLYDIVSVFQHRHPA